MVSLLFWKRNNNLLQERKRFIDELCFKECFSFRSCFFSSFRPGQVNEVQFGNNNLLWGLNSGPDFQVDRKDTVWPWGCFIQFMLWHCSICLSFKNHGNRFFFCRTFFNEEAFNIHISVGIFLDSKILTLIS